MKIKGSSYFLIVIILIMLVTIVASLRMEDFESKFLPLTFASLILVLAVMRLWREIKAGGETAGTTADDETGSASADAVGWRGYLVHGSWVVGFALGIYLLGFLVAIPIFMLAYMRWLGTRWLTVIISAIVTPAILYGLFEIALKTVLYRGLLFTWLD